MNNFKRSFESSLFFNIFITILVLIIAKSLINPLLIAEQERLNDTWQLSDLPDITSLKALNELIDTSQFNAIEINNDLLSQPITFQNTVNRPTISSLISTPDTLVKSTITNQTIKYSATNLTLYDFYNSFLLIVILALIVVLINNKRIYSKLLKDTEMSLVDEIANNSKVITFNDVSLALSKHKREFNEQLSLKQKEIEQYVQKVGKSNLPQLNTRQAFRKELTAFLSGGTQQKQAILSVIRIFELSAINMNRVFDEGESHDIVIAKLINKVLQKFDKVHLYRLSRTDFSIIAYGISISEAQLFSHDLKLKFDEYQMLNNLENVAFHGLTSITSRQLPEQVLERVDIALAKAQTSGVNAWAFENSQDSLEIQVGEQYWRTTIEQIIKNSSFMFLQQPVQPVHNRMTGYQEIFTRFISVNGNTIPTGTIFSMAQQTDKLFKLEKSIIEKIVHYCRPRAEGNEHWGLNISSATLQNSSFIVWLERLLLREQNVAAALVFEVNESMLESNLTSSKRFFDMLKRVGSHSAICSFGKGIGSFRLFKELKPNYIKINSALITNIENDSSNQQFIRMIIDVAHRMECQVIAEGIEHIEQKEVLERMYLDGIQGYLIARPSPL